MTDTDRLYSFCYEYTRTMALAAIRDGVNDEELTDEEFRRQVKGIIKVLENSAGFYSNSGNGGIGS